MKRLLGICSVLASTVLLSSCLFGGGRFFRDSDEKIAKNGMEQGLDAVVRKDKEALKSMFSKTALAEAEDFENRMDYLFNFFQGEVKPWKDDDRNSGPAVHEHNDHGHVTKEFTYWYYIDTDKESYLFFIVDYVEDTDHPDNVGLYTLRAIRAEDRETEFTNSLYMKIPGIYKPTET